MAKSARFGSADALHIFQDDFFDQQENMVGHMPAPSKPARRPLQSSNSNVVLNPPSTSSSIKQSPFKSNPRLGSSPPAPLKVSQSNKLNRVPMMAPTSQAQSTDCLEKKQPLMSRFKTVAQKPVSYDLGVPLMSKENAPPPIYPAPPTLNISMETYYPKPHGKRMLMDAAPIKEIRPAKKPRLDESQLPPHDSFAPIMDDGNKPGHSYASLIGMAILRSPHRRLTLAQIYKWISDTFSFYNAQDAGWQNSIRHNLSLNKNFIKQERPKDDPGKGNYWAIEPGMEHVFMKEKPTRKPTAAGENLSVMSTRLEPSQQPLAIIQEPILPPQAFFSQSSLPPLPPPSSQAGNISMVAEVSSDATIGVSEGADAEEPMERSVESEAVNDVGLYSPLPAAMHSSPPIPKHIETHRSGTPPPVQRHHASSGSRSRSHKRKLASMDDSGYISSLESSAMRPQQQGRLLTSEADRPRIKRGRAEEEIARLRASSYDSPTKGRSWNGYAPPSSSPLRQNSYNDGGQMLPPLTPAMKLKAPPKPPPSVSPSTNLRLHRESVRSMIESPYRRAGSILPKESSLQLTPGGLNVDEFFYGHDRLTVDSVDFDIFQDGVFAPMFPLSPGIVLNGSPAKRSVKKQRLDRHHSMSALADMTNSSTNNSLNASCFLKVPNSGSAAALDTPSNAFNGLLSSPSKFFQQSPSKASNLADAENIAPWISLDDLCSPEFLDDTDFGIDMLAGFEKIGSATAQLPRQPKLSQKPPLGRSYSTAF